MLCALLPLALRLCRDRIAAVRAAAAAQAEPLLARLVALAAPPDPAAETLSSPTFETASLHQQDFGAAAARAVPRPPTPDPGAKAAGRLRGTTPAGVADSCQQQPADACDPAAEAAGRAGGGAVPGALLDAERAEGAARSYWGAAGSGVGERAGAATWAGMERTDPGPRDELRAGGASRGGGGGAAAAGPEAGPWAGFDAAGHWVDRLGELAGERCHQLRLAFLGACASVLLGAWGPCWRFHPRVCPLLGCLTAACSNF